MAHPKRRTSKSVKNMRRSHLALDGKVISNCPSCGAPKRSHRVCGACGHYRKDLTVAV